MSAHPDAAERTRNDAGLRLTGPVRADLLRRGAQEAVAALQRAFAWWVGELAATLPARLRERFTSTGRRLTVVVDGQATTVLVENGGAPEQLGRLDLGPHANPAAALGSVLARCKLAAALADGTLAAGARLPADKALRTEVDLPIAAEANLDEVIAFELDRHTPFRADQVYVAPRILRRDPIARRLTVELTIIPRTVADEALQLAERLGLRLERLDVAPSAAGDAASGNLLPPARVAAARRQASRLTYALALLAMALAVVAVSLPLVRLQRDAAATAAQFATIRTAVAMQRRIEALNAQRQFIVTRKHATVRASTLLLELTRLLPDDTTLTTLRITGDTVELGGTAHSAAALIDLLERSHRFKDTKFRTPVTQDPATGRETFYIVAQTIPGATP